MPLPRGRGVPQGKAAVQQCSGPSTLTEQTPLEAATGGAAAEWPTEQQSPVGHLCVTCAHHPQPSAARPPPHTHTHTWYTGRANQPTVNSRARSAARSFRRCSSRTAAGLASYQSPFRARPILPRCLRLKSRLTAQQGTAAAAKAATAAAERCRAGGAGHSWSSQRLLWLLWLPSTS